MAAVTSGYPNTGCSTSQASWPKNRVRSQAMNTESHLKSLNSGIIDFIFEKNGMKATAIAKSGNRARTAGLASRCRQTLIRNAVGARGLLRHSNQIVSATAMAKQDTA